MPVANRRRPAAANSEPTAPRVRGRPFQKGKSGNPTGRPKGVAAAARELINDDPSQLLRIFLNVARNTKAKPTDRVAAAREYLDRAYGKAPAYAPVEGGDPLALDIDSDIAAVLDELAARRETPAASVGPDAELAGTG